MLRPGSLAWLLCPLMCFHSGAAFAQKSPPPNEKISAAEILKRHTAAMGGEETVRNLQTLHVRGVVGVVNNRSYGDVNFYYQAPDRDVFRFESPAYGLSAIGHSGGKPFQEFTRPSEGLVGMSGVALGAMEIACLGMIEWAYEQNYIHIELVGLSQVGGRWAYGLRFTSKYGDQQLRFFDAESFFLARIVLLQRLGGDGAKPYSTYTVETTFSDYRTSGGIPFPMRVNVKDPRGNFYLEVHNVRQDEHLDGSIFTRNY